MQLQHTEQCGDNDGVDNRHDSHVHADDRCIFGGWMGHRGIVYCARARNWELPVARMHGQYQRDNSRRECDVERLGKIIVFLLLAASPLFGQWDVGQRSHYRAAAPSVSYVADSYAEASSTGTATLSTSCNGGELMVINVENLYHNTTAFTMSISAGTAQTIHDAGNGHYDSAASYYMQSYYISNCAAGSFTLSAAPNSGTGYTAIAVSRYTGLSTLNVAGAWTSNTFSSTSGSASCSVTTSTSATLIATVIPTSGGYHYVGATWSGQTAGYTMRSGRTGYVLPWADNIGASAGSNTFSINFTGSSQRIGYNECVLLAFN